METNIYKDAKRRRGVPQSAFCEAKEGPQLSFPAPIVEYNAHMGGSDGNAQQRSYYSAHRPDNRYWWPIFTFLIDAAVLNAFKLWGLLHPDSKLTHAEFQFQIIEGLLMDGSTKQRQPIRMVETPIARSTCGWEGLTKRAYCGPCKEKAKKEAAGLKRRRPLGETSGNIAKRQRIFQTIWQYLNCGPCYRKRTVGSGCILKNYNVLINYEK